MGGVKPPVAQRAGGIFGVFHGFPGFLRFPIGEFKRSKVWAIGSKLSTNAPTCSVLPVERKPLSREHAGAEV